MHYKYINFKPVLVLTYCHTIYLVYLLQMHTLLICAGKIYVIIVIMLNKNASQNVYMIYSEYAK